LVIIATAANGAAVVAGVF